MPVAPPVLRLLLLRLLLLRLLLLLLLWPVLLLLPRVPLRALLLRRAPLEERRCRTRCSAALI